MKRSTAQGYSLIEVVIAGAVLMMAIAAVTAMALMTVAQQETNVRISQAINYQEQAARLYQLGLSPTTILSILPPEPGVSLTFQNATTGAIGEVNGMERIECVMEFQPNPTTSNWSEGHWVGGTTDTRVNSMIVVRPSIR